MSGPATTVVVARQIRPGRDREAQRWIERIRREAATAPGFLGSTAHPPGDAHPDEWLVVYRFATAAQLDDWLASPARQGLLDQSADLFDDAREQRLAEAPTDQSVTLISSVHLAPGTEDDHRALHHEGVRAAARSGGLVRDELLPAVPDVQAETVALLTFATQDDLDRWLTNPERHDVLARMEPLLVGERTVNVVGGFAGWFQPAGAVTKRWKQAATVLLALVPLSLAVTQLRTTVVPGLPTPVAVTGTAVVNVAALTWVLMPYLTRRLEPWLTT